MNFHTDMYAAQKGFKQLIYLGLFLSRDQQTHAPSLYTLPRLYC